MAVTGSAVADPVTAAIAKTDIVSMRFMTFSLQSVFDELPQIACGSRRWHLTQRENVPASSGTFPTSRVDSSALNKSSAAISCFLSASLTTADRRRLPRLAPHRHRGSSSAAHGIRARSSACFAVDRDYRHVRRVQRHRDTRNHKVNLRPPTASTLG